MKQGNVSRGGRLAQGALGFDDATIEKAAMAVAWGELGLGARVRSIAITAETLFRPIRMPRNGRHSRVD